MKIILLLPASYQIYMNGGPACQTGHTAYATTRSPAMAPVFILCYVIG